MEMGVLVHPQAGLLCGEALPFLSGNDHVEKSMWVLLINWRQEVALWLPPAIHGGKIRFEGGCLLQ